MRDFCQPVGALLAPSPWTPWWELAGRSGELGRSPNLMPSLPGVSYATDQSRHMQRDRPCVKGQRVEGNDPLRSQGWRAPLPPQSYSRTPGQHTPALWGAPH